MGLGWHLPTGCEYAIDLRNPSQAANTNAAEGFALFFSSADLGVDYSLVGDVDDNLRAAARQWVQTHFGVSLPGGLNVGQAVHLLMQQLDPAGENSALPLGVTRRQRVEVWLGDRWLRQKLDARLHNNILDATRRNYAAVRRRVLAGALPPRHHLKYLATLQRALRLDYKVLLNGEPDEGLEEPTTTYIESFNKDDSTTLGPDQTWTEQVLDWSVISNQAGHANNNHGYACIASALSDTAHYAQTVKKTTGTTNAEGSIVRSSNATGASGACFAAYGFSGTTYIRRYTSGGSFSEVTSKTLTPANNDVYKLQIDGSSLTLFVNTVSQLTATDTNLATNLHAGMFSFGAAGRVDDVEISDVLSTPSMVARAIPQFRRRRA